MYNSCMSSGMRVLTSWVVYNSCMNSGKGVEVVIREVFVRKKRSVRALLMYGGQKEGYPATSVGFRTSMIISRMLISGPASSIG